MGIQNLRFFAIFLVLVAIILSLYFVVAWVGQTSGVVLSQNTTYQWDEGNFFINWSGYYGAEADVNTTNATLYIIWVWVNNTASDGDWSNHVPWTNFTNSSPLGYDFSNTTLDANYTFYVQPWNSTGYGDNSTNVTIHVDSTAPVITMPQYTNGTLKRSTDTLILNISFSDALSGTTGTLCSVDVNGTNQTIALSSGWCNISTINLTNLADGNQTIKVWVNDTANTFGLNNSYVVYMDTTSPGLSLSLASSARDSLTITISGADGSCTADRSGASISGSTLTESNLICGISYSYTVTCIDAHGNSGTSLATAFTTDSCGGAGTSTPSFWTNTYIVPEEELEQGYTKELAVKNRVRVRIGTEDHHVGIKSLTETQATIEVSSDPVEVVLDIGEDTKVDVTDDDFYDIYVILNGISNNKADITVQKIYEEIPEEELEGAEGEGEGAAPTEGRNLTWLWILIAVVILIAIGWGIKKKK